MKKEIESFDHAENVASMTECTGLMPVLPEDSEQDDNVAQLYAIHRASRIRPKCRRR